MTARTRAWPSGPLVFATTDAVGHAFDLEQLLTGLGYRVVRSPVGDVLALLSWAERARRMLSAAERAQLDEIGGRLGELVHERGAQLELCAREVGWDRCRRRMVGLVGLEPREQPRQMELA